MSAAFIGLDLAKSVFQVHGVDGQGGCGEAAAPGYGAGVLRQSGTLCGWERVPETVGVRRETGKE